jgi:hypothetical protein
MSDWHFQKYPDIVAFKQQLLLKSIPELEEIRERCIDVHPCRERRLGLLLGNG